MDGETELLWNNCLQVILINSNKIINIFENPVLG